MTDLNILLITTVCHALVGGIAAVAWHNLEWKEWVKGEFDAPRPSPLKAALLGMCIAFFGFAGTLAVLQAI